MEAGRMGNKEQMDRKVKKLKMQGENKIGADPKKAFKIPLYSMCVFKLGCSELDALLRCMKPPRNQMF